MTLEAVAGALADARDAWWIVSGAAVALHGYEGEIGDVDVLTSVHDADRLIATLRLDRAPPSERFRSERFARWCTPPLPVEIMAGFEVHTPAGWQSVTPRTREPFRLAAGTVFIPSRTDLAAILRLFGRPKDWVRAAWLDG